MERQPFSTQIFISASPVHAVLGVVLSQYHLCLGLSLYSYRSCHSCLEWQDLISPVNLLRFCHAAWANWLLGWACGSIGGSTTNQKAGICNVRTYSHSMVPHRERLRVSSVVSTRYTIRSSSLSKAWSHSFYLHSYLGWSWELGVIFCSALSSWDGNVTLSAWHHTNWLTTKLMDWPIYEAV